PPQTGPARPRDGAACDFRLDRLPPRHAPRRPERRGGARPLRAEAREERPDREGAEARRREPLPPVKCQEGEEAAPAGRQGAHAVRAPSEQPLRAKEDPVAPAAFPRRRGADPERPEHASRRASLPRRRAARVTRIARLMTFVVRR